MTRLLIVTKLHSPQLRRGLVARPRLLARMESGAEARLTLVSAPAGFGKSTVLAAWLQAARGVDRRVAWLSCDEADHEPTSFWTYVLTALEGAVPDLETSAVSDLLGATPLPTELMLTTLLNELATAPVEVWLVFDDFHLVGGREVGQDDVPAGASPAQWPRRAQHPRRPRSAAGPLARWRARGELVEIRAADLRFTSDETTAYLTERSAALSPATSPSSRSGPRDGSPRCSCRSLAPGSLRRERLRCPVRRRRPLHRRLPGRGGAGAPPRAVRGFLLRFSTGSPGRCATPSPTATTGGQLILTLERANLFVVGLDDRREWYRYHHLFADVLRARLLSQRPDLFRCSTRRASRWCERHDLLEEAAGHALAASDVHRAARLMELAVSMIRRHRQEAMMYDWLRALPAEVVRSRPVLSVFYGSMLMASGDLDGVGPWPEDPEGALAAVPAGAPVPWADTDDLLALPSTIAMYRAALAQARAMRPVRRHTPGTPWTWPVRTSISRVAERPDFSASQPGAPVTCQPPWLRSRRRSPACTPPAASSTS